MREDQTVRVPNYATMLDLGALAGVGLRQEPFAWARLDAAFQPDVAEALSRTFPRDGFAASTPGSGSDKAYRTFDRPIVTMGRRRASVGELPAPWPALVDALSSPDFTQAVEALTGRHLGDTVLEVRATRYRPGCWIGPHTDRADKAVTVTWYLNERWDPAWGGCLRLLRSADVEDVHSEISPSLGASVVIVPSASSWHTVTPVRPEAAEDRCAVLLHFVRTGSNGGP